MIGRGMTDLIVEPVRKCFIPGFEEVKKAASKAGVAGVAISGSGPGARLAVVNQTKVSVYDVPSAMKDTYENLGFECKGCATHPSIKIAVKI